jgi:hypothetical protein
MIEALKGFPENTVAFAARGQLTQSDYRAVVVPAVETHSRHTKSCVSILRSDPISRALIPVPSGRISRLA